MYRPSGWSEAFKIDSSLHTTGANIILEIQQGTRFSEHMNHLNMAFGISDASVYFELM